MWNEFFAGKVVVVSGGAAGIGAATSQGFARAGATTVVNDVADELGQEIVDSLNKDGHRAIYRHCDVANESEVEELFGWVLDTYGPLEAVSMNAGVEWMKDVRSTTLDEWRRVLDVNLTGAFLVGRAALSAMCHQELGSLVITSSPHAWATVPDAGAYAASKGGVHALIRALALEAAPFGVRVNGVVPGTVDTPMVRREAMVAGDFERQMRLFAASHPLGRIGQPSEIANVTMFLASPLASFVTGAMYQADGGLMAALPSGPPLSYNN
ncbi:MAG: SDR family NAD(P)-dependent oxidoreductase [Acidimicrobiales bacterium]